MTRTRAIIFSNLELASAKYLDDFSESHYERSHAIMHLIEQ
jgi:hypothetical protein